MLQEAGCSKDISDSTKYLYQKRRCIMAPFFIYDVPVNDNVMAWPCRLICYKMQGHAMA